LWAELDFTFTALRVGERNSISLPNPIEVQETVLPIKLNVLSGPNRLVDHHRAGFIVFRQGFYGLYDVEKRRLLVFSE
jgi:hypothetical protein